MEERNEFSTYKKDSTAMTFTSFAQNLEDVLLWRALKHVGNGFYIDVGAHSPEGDSVTKAFYDKGWSGVNIEPNTDFREEYQQKRERDVTLAVVLGEAIGISEIHFMENSGLSTIKPEIVAFHDGEGCEVTKVKKVQMLTLSDVCHKYAKDKDIHFLKVDVEGAESEVLRGGDWEKYRPWIVVVEATYPMSQKETYNEWEPFLLDKQYQFTFADGLNRYYVADEHKALQASFRFPPNVFDNYKRAEQVAIEERLSQAAEFAQKQQNLIDQMLVAKDVLTSQNEEFEANRQLMVQRITSLEQQLNETSNQMTALQEQHKEANKLLNEQKIILENQVNSLNSHIANQENLISGYKEQAAVFKGQIVHQEAHIHAITQQLAACQHELSTAYNTKSWRVTKPLRAVGAFLKKIRAKFLKRAEA